MTDSLTLARTARPGHKLLLVIDQRTVGNLGVRFVASVAPGSAWHAMLPDEQTITLTDAGPVIEPPPIILPERVTTYMPKGRPG